MRFFGALLSCFIACLITFIPAIGTETFLLKSLSGEEFVVNANPNDSDQQILTQIEQHVDFANHMAYLNNAEIQKQTQVKEFLLDYLVAEIQSPEMLFAKSTTSTPRNYNEAVNPSQKKDISFIVKTIANNSMVKILKYKSSLEKAGDRVNSVHPLRFLMCIFTDEELKVCIRNIQSKGWAWSNFMGGLSDSLTEEYNRNNMTDDFIQNFAATVGINPSIIYPAISGKNWHELVNLLIKYIPRQGDTNRYDM